MTDSAELEDLFNFLIESNKCKKIEKFRVSDFISKHNHINYCEAIISPNGLIGYVYSSHVNSLIGETGKTKSEIESMMDLSMTPIEWLCNYTGCISVWYNSVLIPSDGISLAQLSTLKSLINSKIVNFKLEDINNLTIRRKENE